MTPKEIAQQLAGSCEAVVKHLLPNGKRDGSEWRVGSVNGEAGKSLGIHLKGTKAGVWMDFASSESGDLLDLWAAVRNIPLSKAINEAKEYSGIRDDYQFSGHKPKSFDQPRKPKCKPPQGGVLEYLTQERGLTPETLTAFKIGEQGRNIIFPYLSCSGELVMCKTMGIDRDENGKKINPPKPTSANQEPCLFGWHIIPENARRVVITEGEIDAMTWYQLGYPALSVPYGGGKGGKQQWIEFEYDRLQRFDEILVSMDSDIPGQEAAQEIVERLGRHRCRMVPELNVKDINEALMAGLTQELADAAIRDAKPMDPIELRSGADYVDDVIAHFYPETGPATRVIYLPWSSADNKLAFRESELTIMNGINGHGKSQIVGNLMLESMKQGQRVCVASMELPPKRLLGKLTQQAGAMINDIPSIPYIRAIQEWYSDKLWVFNVVGTAKTKRLLEVFKYARQRYDIQLFVIDSLMKCGIAEDDYNGQKKFVEALTDFKNEHGCHVILVTHSRKGDSENKIIGKLDVKGTGAITDLADTVLTTWRNKPKERAVANARVVDAGVGQEILDTPDAKLICDKQRNGSWEGVLPLWFCRGSNQFLGSSKTKPCQYVNYSQQGLGRGEDSHE